MKSRTFLILLILLCVIASLTYLTLSGQQSKPLASRMGEKMFENLPAADRIHAIHITQYRDNSLQTTRVSKSNNSTWVVENLYDYPADFKLVLELVEKIKNAKIGRHFEASPDTLLRLNLHEPSENNNIGEDHKSIRIQLMSGEQKPLVDILLGKPRESDTGDGGHYIKRTGDNIIFLVDQTFRFIDTQPREWIQSELLNVDPEEIKTVICRIPGDQNVIYEITRDEKGAPPQLQNPQYDKGTLKNHRVEAVLDTLSSLRISNVAGRLSEIPDETTGFNSLPVIDFELFDGTRYRAFIGNIAEGKDEGYYFKIDSPEKSDWIFVIPEWTRQSMTTDPALFFDQPEDSR